ncbi:WbqC family protein [Arundinibacter roseus]|uniref:WbqC family protein n=1 Tax=Arundinibacter roseus TaxID=2070510 RepID=A0A4R4KJT9_9BACT|nr:WbqC family protein [Arundinibacter roseus]TDB68263.1 hypothetical protein EZE20_04920 [Arundinibacter roseus]
MTDQRRHSSFPTEVTLDLHYLPCLDYFSCLLNFDSFILEAQDHYIRQTYRNRCYVLTANGIDVLTVPVLSGRNKVLIRDVKIDYGQAWVRRHWGCLQSAYGKSPFFEYYEAEFKQVYQRQTTFLFDLNVELLTLCLKFLGIKKEIAYTLSYSRDVTSTNFDARSLISDKNTENIFKFHVPIPYYQTFGNDFVKNLSIVDLLFNKGPEARQILMQSKLAPPWSD